MPGSNFYEIVTTEDFVRWAFRMLKASADAVYCAASYATVKRMRRRGHPVCGHVGLIPSQAHLDRRLQAVEADGVGAGTAKCGCPAARGRGPLKQRLQLRQLVVDQPAVIILFRQFAAPRRLRGACRSRAFSA